MQDPLPLNNKPLDVHILKWLVFTIFHTNGGLLTKVLDSFLFSQKRKCTQNCYFSFHKSTLNNVDISTRTTSKIKPDTLVCFLTLLQVYLILSTYPSLKLRWIKKNCIIWLFFVLSVIVRSLPPNNNIFASYI